MTKARAAERAKSNALKKAKKRVAKAATPDAHAPTNHFDPGTQTIKSPHAKGGGHSFGGVRRGAARSK